MDKKPVRIMICYFISGSERKTIIESFGYENFPVIEKNEFEDVISLELLLYD